MKFIKNTHSLALCLLTLCSTIQVETIAKESAAATETQADPSEKGLQQAFSQLQQIDTYVTQLALLVANGSIHNISSPKETIRIFRDIRGLIGSLSKDQIAILGMKNSELNDQLTGALTYICDELIIYLEKGLSNKLNGLKPFDIEKLTKRGGLGKKQTRSAIKQSLRKIDNKIEALKHSVDNAGLTWYNKIARAADKYIVTPANNYHIPTIAFYGGGAALVSGYFLWLYGKEFKEHPNTNEHIVSFIDAIYNRFSQPLLRDQYDQIKDDAEKGKHHPLAVAELAVRQTLGNQNPIVAVAGGYFAHAFYEDTWKNKIRPNLIEKRDHAWNFLRGGAFLNQASQGEFFTEPKVNFDDMVGLDEVKEQFSTIIQYLENPERFANMNASPEKGWLLTGPKRTGKSFSFECLCGEIVRMQAKHGKKNEFKFLNIDAALIHERGIKLILDVARSQGPMVLFIDEIDLLNLSRVGDTKLLNEFLTAIQSSMDQDPSKVVIIIAATNKPQTLDPALRANGRFGKEIRFEYPAKKYRIEYITKILSSMALDVRQFDIERLAAKTDQKSFEDLGAIIRTAMTRAWLYGQPLTQQLLEESIDTEIHHIIMTDRKDLPEHENRILASHFAGRALATLYLPMNAKLDKVTIHAHMTDLAEETHYSELYKDKDEKDKEKKIEHGHLTTKLLHDSIHVRNEEHIRNEAKARIAGFVAEELLLGSCGFTCHSHEHERAYKLIEQLVFGGLNPKLVAKNICEELRQKSWDLLQQCKAEVRQLLTEHQAALSAIAQELMEKSILTDKEVQKIIDKAEGRVVAEEVATETPNTDDALFAADDIEETTNESAPAIEK
jgi:SpoVK/Ycf46/Vps4 family AAA+-type ATPase